MMAFPCKKRIEKTRLMVLKQEIFLSDMTAIISTSSRTKYKN
eukprot:jgi/Antlo1/1707/1564